MGILNRTNDGLASVLLTLWRTLRVMGPRDAEQLIELCAPLSLGDHSDAFKSQKHVRQTLRRWTDMGLFVLRDDSVALAEPFDQLDPGECDFRTFRACALDVALAGRRTSTWLLTYRRGTGIVSESYIIASKDIGNKGSVLWKSHATHLPTA